MPCGAMAHTSKFYVKLSPDPELSSLVFLLFECCQNSKANSHDDATIFTAHVNPSFSAPPFFNVDCTGHNPLLTPTVNHISCEQFRCPLRIPFSQMTTLYKPPPQSLS